ncbi:MAG: trypsin-like peptidase domain-containing protein [Desulfobacterium sp.]|nr:trypsin-like peptidase domain-containing protein [Desulfobacterium sp.]
MARIAIAIYLLLIGLTGNAIAGDNQESFYAKIGRTVIRLEYLTETLKEGNVKSVTASNPDGTGFFILSGNSLFLVTARHVVDTDHDLRARVNIFNEVTKKSAILLLRLPRKNWIFHPDNGNDKIDAVDVAVIKLPIPIIEGDFSNSFGAFIYDPNNSKDNQLPAKDALPPEQVVAFGFPGDTGFKLLEQRPMGRFGIIAMVTGEEFVKIDNNKFANGRCSMLDIKAFPGNSGSPVISATGNINLLGVLIASNSSDFALIEPVSRIREIMDIAIKTPIQNYDYWSKYQLNP